MALAGGVLTRSVLGGLFVFAQAVIHLTAIANEPGHLQELVTLLLALGIFTVSVGRRLPLMLAILCALGAALAVANSWLLGACLLFLFANIWSKPHVWRERYVQLVPLDLPGTTRLRLERESVDVHQALIGYLAASSDTFITYPGYNSIYFWTGKRPPTFWNATGWGPLSEAQRLEVLAALRRAKRAMIVFHENILKGWANRVPKELEPLVLCVRDECEPVRQFGPFVVFQLGEAKRQ